MPVPLYDTRSETDLEAANLSQQQWERDILPQLPAALSAHAYALGAFTRRRGFQSPVELLRGLMAYAMGNLSWRGLGAWAVVVQLADLSDTAWRKHLVRSHAWLAWLTTKLFCGPACTSRLFTKTQGRLLLVDATRLRVPGGRRDAWFAHCAYDLVCAQLVQVSVADVHSSEHLGHYALKQGDIAVCDRAYGRRRNVAYACQHQADVVLRITPTSLPLKTLEGDDFDLRAWLKQRHTQKACKPLLCQFAGKRYPVRLIAVRLPKDKADQARKRQHQSGQRSGYTPSKQSLQLAQWMLLLTTLDQKRWPIEEVVGLYRGRWQVELVFKRMKQLLRLNTLRVQSPRAIEAVLYLQLIAWLLQEEEGRWLREHLQVGEAAPPCQSSWQISALCVSTLRQAVLGYWTKARVRACLERLARYLCGSPRKRVHQESQLRRWLQERLALPDRTRQTLPLAA